MGRSVMHDAAEHGSVRVLEWLRVHGARADISSREVRCMLPHQVLSVVTTHLVTTHNDRVEAGRH